MPMLSSSQPPPLTEAAPSAAAPANWIRVPAGTNGSTVDYYYQDGDSCTSYEPPDVPRDRMWSVYTCPSGCFCFHNEATQERVWKMPGPLGDRRRLAGCAVHRDRKDHEWDMHMIVPASEYASCLYDPDVSVRALSARLAEPCDEEEPDDDMWVFTAGVTTQEGVQRPACAWDLKAEYYTDAAENAEWTLPGVAGTSREAECPGGLLPAWMCPRSAVRMARLPRSLRRLEGLCGNVEHINAGKVQIMFPEFFGPDYYEVEPGWVAPLRPGMLVQLKNLQAGQEPREDACVCVLSFEPLSLEPYTVVTCDGTRVRCKSWQLKPYVPFRDFTLSQPVQELTWKKTPEQHVTFTDSMCRLHFFTMHLPLGWNSWMAHRNTTPWPLLVYMHGNGGEGTLFHSTKKSLRGPGLRFCAENFVVVSPDCKWRWKQDPDVWVLELIDTLRACQWIDADRIYLAGYSMGGMGTWVLGARRPDLFAGIAPIASYHKQEYEAAIASRLAKMPVLVAASAVDDVCFFKLEVPLCRRLMESGNKTLQVFLHESTSHGNMWDVAFCHSEFLYRWFLAHSKC